MRCIDCLLCTYTETPVYFKKKTYLDDEKTVRKFYQMEYRCKALHAVLKEPFNDLDCFCGLYLPSEKNKVAQKNSSKME